MKRLLADGNASGNNDSATAGEKDANKRIEQEAMTDEGDEMSKEAEAVLMDENLLYEVLRRVDDGRTLAKAACVSRQWRRAAHDERIWELICTKHYQRCPMQLRAVVSAIGGFRHIYTSLIWPLLNPFSASSSAAPRAVFTWPCIPSALPPCMTRTRWGKEEVNLSLSILSIKYFEKMSSDITEANEESAK